jgi:hypothetical protein
MRTNATRHDHASKGRDVAWAELLLEKEAAAYWARGWRCSCGGEGGACACGRGGGGAVGWKWGGQQERGVRMRACRHAAIVAVPSTAAQPPACLPLSPQQAA